MKTMDFTFRVPFDSNLNKIYCTNISKYKKEMEDKLSITDIYQVFYFIIPPRFRTSIHIDAFSSMMCTNTTIYFLSHCPELYFETWDVKDKNKIDYHRNPELTGTIKLPSALPVTNEDNAILKSTLKIEPNMNLRIDVFHSVYNRSVDFYAEIISVRLKSEIVYNNVYIPS
jgi:hypothetical protein